MTKKQTSALRLSFKASFTSSKLTHKRGFSTSLLGIECKHSLLSHAASVPVLKPSQALDFIFLFILFYNKGLTKKALLLLHLFYNYNKSGLDFYCEAGPDLYYISITNTAIGMLPFMV